ncbi:MAG: hypothetical protein V8S84_08350 [Lachnospiraceae bacterium]
MNAFIFWNGGLSLSDDGTEVIAPFTQDAWREGLTYLNELSSEGLLSANIFTDDGQQFKAILNQETPIVGLTTAGSLSNWPDVKNNKNFAEYGDDSTKRQKVYSIHHITIYSRTGNVHYRRN